MKAWTKKAWITVSLLATLSLAGCRAVRPSNTAAPEPTPTVHPTAQPVASKLHESPRDILGFYQTSSAYEAVMKAGTKVVNVPQLGSFFTIWVPSDYAQQGTRRVMVLVHGSNGDAYSTIAGRLRHAQRHRYALVAIQWWLGEDEIYLPTEAVYQLLTTALEYMAQEYDADIHKAAYEGFSRGSAISYEIAYLDRTIGGNYFALFICQSGGMHDPGPPFIESLRAGELGNNVFEGQHFFMYCGMQDEQWGSAMCDYMHNAEQLVTEYGGTVERFIEDPQGGHAGLLKTDAYYEDAIETWFELTSD